MNLPGKQSPFVLQMAAEYGHLVPRWLWLAMPDDVAQEIALARLATRTEAQFRAMLRYRLRLLRRDNWDRWPKAHIKAPVCCRPSKIAAITGYRTDSAAHREARLTKVLADRRAEIAREGLYARKSS